VFYLQRVLKHLVAQKQRSSLLLFPSCPTFAMSKAQSSIWYLLVDSNGTPFKNTSVSSVSLHVAYNVDQFRKRVKEANSHPACLGPYIPSALKVFSNRIHFNVSLNGPLPSYKLMTNMGMTGQTPVLVLVPNLPVIPPSIANSPVFYGFEYKFRANRHMTRT
jgi:hypothetical protein